MLNTASKESDSKWQPFNNSDWFDHADQYASEHLSYVRWWVPKSAYKFRSGKI